METQIGTWSLLSFLFPGPPKCNPGVRFSAPVPQSATLPKHGGLNAQQSHLLTRENGGGLHYKLFWGNKNGCEAPTKESNEANAIIHHGNEHGLTWLNLRNVTCCWGEWPPPPPSTSSLSWAEFAAPTAAAAAGGSVSATASACSALAAAAAAFPGEALGASVMTPAEGGEDMLVRQRSSSQPCL